MKNEDFKFDRDKIDREMSEIFAFDPTCGEKAVHDAIKEKMRREAARKNRSTRNRLIVSTAASLAVVVTAVTLLPALFSNKNVNENLGNGFAPGTNSYYGLSEKDEELMTDGITEIVDYVPTEYGVTGEVEKYFKYLSDNYKTQLSNDSVLVVYKNSINTVYVETKAEILFKLREVMIAESERNDLSYDNSDTLTYCPIEEPIEETMISTEATPLEPVEEAIAAVYDDTYAAESMFVCELPEAGEDTTYVTSSGKSDVPMEEDVADAVIIYPEGDSLAVWLDDMLIDETGYNIGKYLYFGSGSRYDPNNYYKEFLMIKSSALISDYEVDFIESVCEILLENYNNAYIPPIDTDEFSIDTTPVEDITSPEKDFALILNGNFENYHTLVHAEEISNITGYLSEMYLAEVGIYGESIFKIGFEYDPETVEYMGITAVDFDENFVVVSSTEFELQSHDEGYCATYDIPEINAGFGRAYFITINAAGEEESILFVDGEATDKLFQ